MKHLEINNGQSLFGHNSANQTISDKCNKSRKRELDRQISASFFERTIIGNSKFSPLVRESNNDLSNTFKDSYVFEFLNLTESHNESDLQRGLVRQMKNFILELG